MHTSMIICILHYVFTTQTPIFFCHYTYDLLYPLLPPPPSINSEKLLLVCVS